ncbi:hypothetical protein GOV05_02020, partial [Candidatus Woesearchaeota archaeon]|nr:hypothetical protein [Candidatus Woesearchaeota archaeon]
MKKSKGLERNLQLLKVFARENPFLIAALIVITIGLVILRPAFTGLVVGVTQETFTIDLGLEINESTTQNLILNTTGIIKSAKISGKILGEGTVRVYLDDKLILDSTNLGSGGGLAGITGFVVEENITIEEEPLPEEPIAEEVVEEIIEEEIVEEVVVEENLTQEPEPVVEEPEIIIQENLTEESIIEENISVEINETIDNITIEENESIIEENLTVEVNETPENITVEENITINVSVEINESIINESVFVNQSINETIEENLTVELNETTVEENITIEVNETIDNVTIIEENVTIIEENVSVEENVTIIEEPILPPTVEENVTNVTTQKQISFSDVCVETCLLNTNKTNYTLRVEVENATVFIDSLSFNVEIQVITGLVLEQNDTRVETIQSVAEAGKPVRWTKKIKLNTSVRDLGVVVHKGAEFVSVRKIVNSSREKLEKDKFRIKKNKDSDEVIIEDDLLEAQIQYYTEAPLVTEKKQGNKKIVVISSDIHYQNIITSTNITPEAPSKAITLYRTTGGIREKTKITYFHDDNDNGLVDRITWVVPHLSNQSYEVEINILNVQSYPMVGGEWIVAFTTGGTADLTISAVDGTTYGSSLPADLTWLSLRCGAQNINASFNGTHVFYEDWNCSDTGYHTVRVLTSGKHTQKFEFGNVTAYAFNNASDDNLTIT